MFARLKPEQFEKCFLQRIAAVSGITAGQVVAIDAKTVRRSHDTGKGAIHMVSAWAAANELVRGQVKVDDKSNWVLDIAFPEDECRVRKDHGPQNLAILRHIAANLLKQEKTAKAGISNKRLRAGWDEEYLRTALAGLFH